MRVVAGCAFDAGAIAIVIEADLPLVHATIGGILIEKLRNIYPASDSPSRSVPVGAGATYRREQNADRVVIFQVGSDDQYCQYFFALG